LEISKKFEVKMMLFERTYNVPDAIRESIPKTLPSVMKIQDKNLMEKVIDAWALSLHLNGYSSLEELPGSGRPNLPSVGNQSQHIESVAKMTMATVEMMEQTLGVELVKDKDLLLASALCHDLGKPYEYAPQNRKRWEADPTESGLPCLRHTLYGVYIALMAGLPESIAHTCGCHSPEGNFVHRSLNTMIIHMVDESFWQILSSKYDWNLPQ
jgi:hypothetical protein